MFCSHRPLFTLHFHFALQLRIPRGLEYQSLLMDAAAAAAAITTPANTPSAPPPALAAPSTPAGPLTVPSIVQALGQALNAAFGPQNADMLVLQKAYRQQVGWVPPAPPSPPPQPLNQTRSGGSKSNRIHTATIVGIVVPVTVAACLVWIALVAYQAASRAYYNSGQSASGGPASKLGAKLVKVFYRGSALLGPIKPPGKGSSTTLVVSDVENSTPLWEELSATVMDMVGGAYAACSLGWS